MRRNPTAEDDQVANFNDFMSIEDLREALAGKSHAQIMQEVESAGIEEVVGKILMGMMMSFNPEAAGGENAMIRYDLKDSKKNYHTYFVKIKDGQCVADQEDPREKPRVHFTTTIPLFLRLSAGQLNLLWPILFRTLRIAGDKVYAKKMKKIFAGNKS
jgi:putative sterol carrier protein